jgi:transposase
VILYPWQQDVVGVDMAWRQGQSYSGDLRSRVLAAVDGGMAVRVASWVFQVSVSYIYKALIRRRQTGAVAASSRRGHRPRKLVFIDETGVNTKMTRLYGRAPRGRRLLATAPFGHWNMHTHCENALVAL